MSSHYVSLYPQNVSLIFSCIALSSPPPTPPPPTPHFPMFFVCALMIPNPFLTLSQPCLPTDGTSLGKRSIKVPNLKSLSPPPSPPPPLPSSFVWARERTFIKIHSIESRFVTGPWNILLASLHMCTLQPRDFTSWGCERVNRRTLSITVFCEPNVHELYSPTFWFLTWKNACPIAPLKLSWRWPSFEDSCNDTWDRCRRRCECCGGCGAWSPTMRAERQ